MTSIMHQPDPKCYKKCSFKVLDWHKIPGQKLFSDTKIILK